MTLSHKRRLQAALVLAVSLSLVGCVVVSAPSRPYENVDWKPDTDGQPFDEWLDANVPIGTPRQEAIDALCDTGLTCWFWDDSTIKCWFLYDAPGDARQTEHSLTLVVKDGAVFDREFR